MGAMNLPIFSDSSIAGDGTVVKPFSGLMKAQARKFNLTTNLPNASTPFTDVSGGGATLTLPGGNMVTYLLVTFGLLFSGGGADNFDFNVFSGVTSLFTIGTLTPAAAVISPQKQLITLSCAIEVLTGVVPGTLKQYSLQARNTGGSGSVAIVSGVQFQLWALAQ